MHVVSFFERVTVAGVTLEPGVGYVMNNTGAGSLLTDRRLVECGDGVQRPLYRLVKASPLGEMKLVPTADYNGCTVWIFRGGGFGDMLMLTPTIREIKRRWPAADVCVVTLPEYADIFEGLDCRVRSGFLPVNELGAGDAAIFYEGVIEDNPEARRRHGVLLFADHAGIELPVWDDHCQLRGEVMRPEYRLLDLHRGWALELFPRTGRRRVGIQATPSAAARTYPPALLVQVINELVARDIEVFVFGKPGQVECDVVGVTNLAAEDGITAWKKVEDPRQRAVNRKVLVRSSGLTFRESAAVLTTCDVLLCPDSALLHLAAALDVPTVALFGSFDAALRVTPGARVTVLQGKADCAPCHWHESGGRQFPPDGPCQIARCCSVLASIKPAQVVAAVEELLQKDARVAKEEREVVVYDLLDHRIGDTVAALYLLSVFCRLNPGADLHLINRGALPIDDQGLRFPVVLHSEIPAALEGARRLNFEFGNLWIAAPSAWKDGFIERFTTFDTTLPIYDVGIHCLTEAGYNVKRNHDPDQFFELHRRLRMAGLNTYNVPLAAEKRPLLEVVEEMRKCRVWIGGDTGFSHLFAALFPDRPLIAIYSDDSNDQEGFADERERMRPWWQVPGGKMSSPWCSDPLSRNLHKFVMQDHQFDLEAVFEKALELANPIEV